MANAHLQYFRTLFAEPAQEFGVSRWGLKEVRLGGEHARYLSWLYPKAKFVFLVREPQAAYSSYKGRYWYHSWPFVPVYSALGYGLVWRRLASSFLSATSEVPSILVRYEDLISDPNEAQRIGHFLELDLQAEIIEQRVGGTPKKRNCSVLDRFWLRATTESLRRRLYS